MYKEVVAKLGNYLPDIHNCITTGFNKAMKTVDKNKRRFDKVAISALINSSIRFEVRKVFPEELFIRNSSRLMVLLINGVVIRFKKLDSNYRAGNISTKQARNFASQQKLPGILPSINLNAGWVLDPTETKIRYVCLTRPSSFLENLWVFDIGGYLANNSVIPEPQIVKATRLATAKSVPLKVAVKSEAQKKRGKRKVKNE